jgi:DNA-binding response OmpR family regulator
VSDGIDSEVLVVDDEDIVVGAIGRILSAHGVKFRVAQSAEEAEELVEQSAPDILLADIKLPGRSGLDLVRIVGERFPAVVSVCMTGYANAEHVLLSLEAGAVDFVPKPFTVDEVLAALTRVNTLVGGRRETTAPTGCHFLDGHSWLRPEEDRTVTLGIMQAYVDTLEPIESIELPAPNTMLRQGGVLVRIKTGPERIHRVWSAAGGRVEQSNLRLEREPGRVAEDPHGEGWIVSVMPTSLDEEIARLKSS